MQPLQPSVYIRKSGNNPDFMSMVHALDEDLYQRNGDVQKQYEQYNQIDKIKHAMVVYVNGEPVGCGCFKPFDKDSVEMKRMFILPEMRGRQLGACLLQELEMWAAEEGFTRAVLETGVRQVEAQRLYEVAGYTRTENYGQYVGMKDSICFQKKLK